MKEPFKKCRVVRETLFPSFYFYLDDTLAFSSYYFIT